MHLRLRFKSSRDRIENFSVMVRGVPHTVDDESLQLFFDEIFPGKVVSIARSYRTPKLDDKLEDRKDAKEGMEKAYATNLLDVCPPPFSSFKNFLIFPHLFLLFIFFFIRERDQQQGPNFLGR